MHLYVFGHKGLRKVRDLIHKMERVRGVKAKHVANYSVVNPPANPEVIIRRNPVNPVANGPQKSSQNQVTVTTRWPY